MTTNNIVKVEGKNLFGEPRKYSFRLVDAKTGLEIFHMDNFHNIMGAAIELIKRAEGEETEEEDDNREFYCIAIAKLFSRTVDWKLLQELSRMLLDKATVTIDEKTTAAQDGIFDIAKGDPTEQYVALAYAWQKNFDKYVPFFAKALVVTSGSKEGE